MKLIRLIALGLLASLPMASVIAMEIVHIPTNSEVPENITVNLLTGKLLPEKQNKESQTSPKITKLKAKTIKEIKETDAEIKKQNKKQEAKVGRIASIKQRFCNWSPSRPKLSMPNFKIKEKVSYLKNKLPSMPNFKIKERVSSLKKKLPTLNVKENVRKGLSKTKYALWTYPMSVVHNLFDIVFVGKQKKLHDEILVCLQENQKKLTQRLNAMLNMPHVKDGLQKQSIKNSENNLILAKQKIKECKEEKINPSSLNKLKNLAKQNVENLSPQEIKALNSNELEKH